MDEFAGTVRLASARDAVNISKLIERCYGDTYVSPEYLNPEHVAREISRKAAFYAVSRTPGREHVGHAALTRVGDRGLFELGKVVVADSHRSQGLFGRMGAFLLEDLARTIKARFVLGRVVTNHLFAQRFGRSAGAVTTGLLLGACPETLRPSGLDEPEQAISYVVNLHRIEKRSRTRELTLCGRDRYRALAALDALSVPATTRGRRKPLPPLGVRIELSRSVGIVHLRFTPGEPPRRLDPGFVEGLRAAGTRVVWADVPTEHPAAPALLEKLRRIGLGYGAYIPLAGPRGEDVVRLQLCFAPLARGAIKVLPDSAHLRDEIFAEARGLEAVAAS